MLLSRAAVLASVAATERRLGAAGRWVLALPPTYVAGRAGDRPVAGRRARAGCDASGRDRAAAWFTSLVPTQLHRLLDDPDDVAALRTCAHRPARRRPDRPGAPRAGRPTAGSGWWRRTARRRPPAAASTTACRWTGWRVAIGTEGRIRIAGPTLFDGYDGDPELTAEALVDGWFLTSDAGRLDEDGRLQVLGRVDDVVVSGGVNVPAPAVAARLREHPDVTDAEVLGVPDAEWGNRVVAFVVGAGSTSTTARELGRRGAPARRGRRAQLVVARRDPAARQRQARPASRCGGAAS